WQVETGSGVPAANLLLFVPKSNLRAIFAPFFPPKDINRLFWQMKPQNNYPQLRFWDIFS
ncbi:MAG: hypothetical protein FWG03_04585, partial [Clostridiales bacterium]|nr:hypothetical protein [Clostridiales bacterium]